MNWEMISVTVGLLALAAAVFREGREASRERRKFFRQLIDNHMKHLEDSMARTCRDQKVLKEDLNSRMDRMDSRMDRMDQRARVERKEILDAIRGLHGSLRIRSG